MSRKISKKEETKRMADRGNWSLDFTCCWVCGNEGKGIMALQIHEMERRSQAPSHHWADPCNYFKTCDTCHMDLLAAMPHARQLAYKYIHDPDNFNLERWLRLRDPELRAPNRVTEQEVMSHVDELL